MAMQLRGSDPACLDMLATADAGAAFSLAHKWGVKISEQSVTSAGGKTNQSQKKSACARQGQHPVRSVKGDNQANQTHAKTEYGDDP